MNEDEFDAIDDVTTIIDHVANTGSEWTITKDGAPVAVIVSYDDYLALTGGLAKAR